MVEHFNLFHRNGTGRLLLFPYRSKPGWYSRHYLSYLRPFLPVHADSAERLASMVLHG